MVLTKERVFVCVCVCPLPICCVIYAFSRYTRHRELSLSVSPRDHLTETRKNCYIVYVRQDTHTYTTTRTYNICILHSVYASVRVCVRILMFITFLFFYTHHVYDARVNII